MCRRARALGAFRLQEHAPLPAEAVELVHEQPAEKRLHRLIDVAERDALLQHLVAIDVGEQLRHRRGELRGDAGQLRPLARRGEELLQVLVRGTSTAAAAAILQPEREAALRAEAGNRRRHHGERRRLGHEPAQLAVEAVDDRPRVELGLVALVPRLEADEVEAVVAGRDARQQAEAGDRVEVGDAVGVARAARRSCGTPRRCARATPPAAAARSAGSSRSPPRARSWSAAAGRAAPRSDREADEQRDADERLAHEPVAHADVAVRRLLEPAVEDAEEAAEHARRLLCAASAASPTAPATASAR